jgi:menaquinone-dependent protoporphyrinogen oxidase
VVILGTAIYAGKPLRAMQDFCERHSGALLDKRLGLFVCGMENEPDKQQQEVANAFSQLLRDKALAVQFLGGEFLFDRMNFLERLLENILLNYRHTFSDLAGGKILKAEIWR